MLSQKSSAKAETQLSHFNSLGLIPNILNLIIKNGFQNPTPIQQASIPAGLEGKDIIGIAQTGTGKTLAFGLSVIQKLALDQNAQGLIVSPTRELAQQVESSLRTFCQPLGIRTCVLIGGEPFFRQRKSLNQKPRLIVATPGRLIDHLKQRTIQLNKIQVLVLDEADRMLDMGFAPQINEILKQTPSARQTLLFSATMPPAIIKLTTSYMKMPVRIEVAPAGSVADKVDQEIILVKQEGKLDLLAELLGEHNGSCLVFSRTRFGAKKITHWLRHGGYTAAEIHADRSQSQRREALNGFSNGKYRILVATDVAARGLDISHVGLVINFDLPDNSDDYIHRIGRTGRAGRSGKAISMATPDQKRDIRDIEKLIRQEIKTSSRSGLTFERPSDREFDKKSGRRRSRFNSRSGGNKRRSRNNEREGSYSSRSKNEHSNQGNTRRKFNNKSARPKRASEAPVRYY